LSEPEAPAVPDAASSAPASLRLFVALWPTPAVRAALAAQRNALSWPSGTALVADERLHLTLHFLGHVSAALLPQLVPALQLRYPRFTLDIGPPQAWPRGLVVLPCTPVPPALRELHATLAAALAGLGMPVEQRPFRPHVTLARRAEGVKLRPAVPRDSPPLHWRVSGHALVWSHPSAGYRVLARYSERGITLATTPQIATTRTPPARRPTAR
jgi:RNA 2',3'-cyclic 3'-phosphodiesterase